MERLSVFIPEETRSRLRKIAKKKASNESVVLREVLALGLRQIEQEEMVEQIKRAQTPALRQRQIDMVRAFEALESK